MAKYRIFIADNDGRYVALNRRVYTRFREAWQTINGGSSNGYTKYLTEMEVVRYNNLRGDVEPQEPCVYFKIGHKQFAIIDKEAYEIYEQLLERKNAN